jgi:hypothetical protein
MEMKATGWYGDEGDWTEPRAGIVISRVSFAGRCLYRGAQQNDELWRQMRPAGSGNELYSRLDPTRVSRRQNVDKGEKSLDLAIGSLPSNSCGYLTSFYCTMGGAADLSTANLARVAVAVTNQSWDKLGLDCDDAAAGTTTPTTTVDAAAYLQLRATAIIMMRLAAITAPPNAYANLATGTISKTILADFMEETTPTNNALSSDCTGESSLSSLPLGSSSGKSGSVDNNKNKKKKYTWPGMVNGQVIVQQVHNFVGRMFQGYKQVPYHNQEHAFHVLQSITKLIDLMITGGGKTYGLKYDPLALFALVFAALIHDVGTCGKRLLLFLDR